MHRLRRSRNRLTVTDALNHAATYVYNNRDRVTSRTDPLTRAESWGR